MKSHVSVAVIGGGVVGCSVLYHLAKLGCSDVVLFERTELTAGSTWHAAGGTSAISQNVNYGRLCRYALELYPELEAESGQSVGYHKVGGLYLARTEERLNDLKMIQSKARRTGVEVTFLSESEASQIAPIISLKQVKGILFEPNKGHVDPNSVTQAFAKAARDRGAEIYRHCPVLETNSQADGSWIIVTPNGTMRADKIVNAAGLWAREVAKLAGAYLPLTPVEHHYFVTEELAEIAALNHEVPPLNDGDAGFYMRQEGKGLLLGAYEDNATLWAVNGTPTDFGHELLPNDLDRIERNISNAIEVVPCLAAAGVKRIINGPMIFSPDLAPLVGPYPGLRNYWCACGVMTAFREAGGIGRTVAEWIVEGEPSLDVTMWDVARYGDWAGIKFSRSRAAEMYETRFAMVFPYEERAAGRPVRTTPVYPILKERGAAFGLVNGWEHPLWYAPAGLPAIDQLTFRRPNWFHSVGDECRSLRENVGLIDITAFAKYRASGPGAEQWLNSVLANRMPSRPGKMLLSPMLNGSGGIIGDFTVARTGDQEFYLTGSGPAERINFRYWEQFLPAAGVTVESVTTRIAAFSISGPNARKLLSRLVFLDISNEVFPFLHCRTMEVGPVRNALVMRLSYTGELGYELHVPIETQLALYQAITAAGGDLGLTHVGSRALNSLQIEKSFLGWLRELSSEVHPYQCGMGRFVKLDKKDFVGRDALRKLEMVAPESQLCTFVVDAQDADPWGGEPIICDGKLAGYISSGAFGHTVGKSIALGYLRREYAEESRDLFVEIIGKPQALELVQGPIYDPTGTRLRS